MKKIGFISDSKSYFKKNLILKELSSEYLNCLIDLGVFDDNEEYEYETLGNKVIDFLKKSKNNYCIALDISGNGILMYANKVDYVLGQVIFNNIVLDEALNEPTRLFSFSSTTSIEEIINSAHKILTKILTK